MKKSLIIAVMLVMVGCLFVGKDASAKTYKADKNITNTFTGTLKRESYKTSVGAQEYGYVLTLKKKIKIKGDIYTKTIKKLQLNGDYDDFLKNVGKKITVKGSLVTCPSHYYCTEFVVFNAKIVKKTKVTINYPIIVKLKNNKVYKNYDVTCDGKADTIKVTSKQVKYKCHIKVAINGKTVFSSKKADWDNEVRLLLMDKKKTLLEVSQYCIDDYTIRGLYSYNKKKWAKVRSLNSGTSKYFLASPSGVVKSITNDTVSIEWTAQNAMTGLAKWTFGYLFVDNKLEYDGNSSEILIMNRVRDEDYSELKKDGSLKARCGFTVYEQPEMESTIVMELVPNETVYFKEIKNVNGRMWYHISVIRGRNGSSYIETGWIPCKEQQSYYPPDDAEYDEYDGESPYFYDVHYAG